jgi:hypothetical protein
MAQKNRYLRIIATLFATQGTGTMVSETGLTEHATQEARNVAH